MKTTRWLTTSRGCILVAFAIDITAVAQAATIPPVPHYVASSAYANVMVDMSVETPMGGAAYADQTNNPPGCAGRSFAGGGEVGACYFADYTYLGLFDPNKCYVYGSGRFEPTGPVGNQHSCSGEWSGNFLNWATMTAADMFIWTMTGGDRDTDGTTETILRRARAIGNVSWFPVKYIANAAGQTPFSGALYISNHDAGGYTFKAGTTRGGNQLGTFDVKVKVCDPSKGLEANCKAYGNVYKPEGLIQRYADKMRFGVFAYTNDNSQTRDGGVLRAPMHYVGEKQMNDQGQLIDNPQKEIDPATGQIFQNPLNAGGGWSGVINYINRFHRDGYKGYDPISEMFYEVIRYFKKLSPTPEYANGAPGGSFPIYTSWNDPIQFYCQKNFVVAINDANPWLDKKLPGTFFTCDKAGEPGMPDSFTANDCGPPSNPDNSIDVSALTNQVGAMEGLHTTWTQNNTTGSDTVGFVYGNDSNKGNCNDGKSVWVSNLAQVMGTCPYAGKQNSYYIAGLAYYANTNDLRGDLPGKQTLNSFFIDTQEYNPNPLDGRRNMLYLAGKYGGFTDLNGNGRPDLQGEWDADGDGQPDNYVLASAPEKIVSGLERAMSNILEKLGSSSNVSVNSGQISSETHVFQASFNSGSWSGELAAYPISGNGVDSQPVWRASEHMPAPGSRKIYTYSAGLKEFKWSQLSQSDRNALGSEAVLEYIRGVRSNELRNGGSFRNRPLNNVLGDIVHSSPVYVKDTDTVYVGANDGMLHAFNAQNGSELFAFIPGVFIPDLKKLTELSYGHRYFVDGGISVSSRKQTPGKNILVVSLGRGDKRLIALDVTNPGSFGLPSHFKWSFSASTDADLGFVLGTPQIAKMNNGDVAVIFGNGYNSSNGRAVLYILKLDDGSLLKKIDTGVGNDNGLATPGLVDEDGDGVVDVIYAGDLKGNVWKFDVSSSQPNQWKSAYLNGSTPKPLFTAKDPSGNPQPITAPITSARNLITGDANYGKRFVFFGTGSYVFSNDPSDTRIQSWYGLIDEDQPISGRNELKLRSITEETTYAGFDIRKFSTASANDMAGKKGWVLDFTTKPGERIVTASRLYPLADGEPVLFASSIIPTSNPCSPGGDGYINALNPFTGGRVSQGIFDLDANGSFAEETGIGGFKPNVGMPGEPVFVGNRLVVGGSAGTIASMQINRQPAGRISWREIVRD